jgi:peptide deformylase
MLKLVSEYDPILKTKCPEYDFSDSLEERQSLVDAMFVAMEANNGIGLASPQIGKSLRMFVMLRQDGTKVACYNPEIIETSDEIISEPEGCLSFPLLYLGVKRPKTITGKYQTITGETVVELFQDIDARCFSHELEHLEGIVFTTKVGPTSLQVARQRQSKLMRKRK